MAQMNKKEKASKRTAGKKGSTPKKPRTAAAAKSPRRASRKTVGPRGRLEKELLSLLPEIDEEGLIFLIRQANVLVNNARVERINREISELRIVKGPTAKDRAVRNARTRPSQSLVTIEESDGGKSFFLTIGEARKILTLEELRRLIRICYSAETKSDALRQLNTVLARERNDILFDARIHGADHPLLDALFTELRARYTLKDR